MCVISNDNGVGAVSFAKSKILRRNIINLLPHFLMKRSMRQYRTSIIHIFHRILLVRKEVLYHIFIQFVVLMTIIILNKI
jgi:hypothetical protein